jgi:hypothetical protein
MEKVQRALFLLNFASFLMLSLAKRKEETQTSSPPAMEFALCHFAAAAEAIFIGFFGNIC